MKKHLTIALFLIFSTALAAQKKTEFGFLFKLGNYHLPHNVTEFGDYWEESPTLKTQKAGLAYHLGIWGSLAVGKHLKLAGELLYRNGWMENEHLLHANYFDGTTVRSYQFSQEQKMNEHALTIPVKLIGKFNKNSRTSFSLGSGLTRIFTAQVLGKTVYSADSPFTGNNYDFPSMRINNDAYKWLLQWNAGVYYAFKSHTSVGIEYNFEKTSKRSYGLYFLTDILIDCNCYGFPVLPMRNMHSFSVSLRHNILN
ncbi:MAG: outer membrane beta-barrel protein [Saprospiraceae bacterium]|nr:outer membrane beta-barrel protein [Saprospiraceae bacterium]